MNRRIPTNLVDLVKIRRLIVDKEPYYKFSIKLDIGYRSFLDRLNGDTRFTLRELLDLADLLDVEIDDILTDNYTEKDLFKLSE